MDDEDRLFLESMANLDEPLDKDRRKRPSREEKLRRLRPREVRDARPEATLDLHGQTVAEGLRSLERFLAESAAGGLRTVVVVTGKGLRSAGGVGVLKRAVEAWLHGAGQRRIRAFAEAPRALGGRGAFVLYLR